MPPPDELAGSVCCLLVRLAGCPCTLEEPQLSGVELVASRPGLPILLFEFCQLAVDGSR